jgi:putative ABC transport system permease protein
MWHNYLIVALRALTKNKTYAFINIFGLALGLAACLTILLYVRYEQSYDDWLPNAENIYQVHSTYTDPDTGERGGFQMTAIPTGTTLKKDFPQIENLAYAFSGQAVVYRGGEVTSADDVLYTHDNLFNVLRIPVVKGDGRRALTQPNSVVVTETEARRHFGNANPVGRTITLVVRGEHVDHRVTGVIPDLPKNSHMRVNMIVRFDPARMFADEPNYASEWGNQNGWNYVSLRPGSRVEDIHAQLPAWEKRNIPDQTFGGETTNAGEDQDWKLVNVRDIHLVDIQNGAMSPGNDRRTILTFTIVALLILGMACVNFTNLATARATQRAREVGLRKVVGATRGQLIVQFLSESIVLVSLAMLLALAFTELTLPLLGTFLDADLSLTYFNEGGLLLPILAMVLVVGGVGGLYPAFYLSRFQPARVLKANKSAPETPGAGYLRSALVIAQFAVSIGLIVCTAVVYSQTMYARTADPGYKREGVLQIAGIGRKQVKDLGETLIREVERVEGVTAAARTSIGVSTPSNMNRQVYVPGRDEGVSIGNYSIDEGFFEVMGIERVAGRLIDRDRPADVTDVPDSAPLSDKQALAARGSNVVVNELAARQLGFADPAKAVGATVRAAVFFSAPEAGLIPLTIVGVVKDSRFRSIRQPIDPIIYRLSSDYLSHLVVRYNSAQPNLVRDRIGAVWKRLAADSPYEAKFSEEIVAELYEGEEARAQTFGGFALLAMVVACLGLFGLAAFTAERRTKEIGIRKVLGARSRDVVRLLAWQFSKPVLIANLIAWPIAWWVMREWLNTFDSRIPLGPTPFLLAGLLALAVAIGTIAAHATKVARSNPIDALRYE